MIIWISAGYLRNNDAWCWQETNTLSVKKVNWKVYISRV